MTQNTQRIGRKRFFLTAIPLAIVASLTPFLALVWGPLGYVGGLISVGIEIYILYLAVLRLHDTDRSGWNLLWSLIPVAGPIVVLVFELQAGTPGPNRFGEPAE